MKLSVTIPFYNESGNIPLIFARLKKIAANNKNIEIILVNNGSTDDSDQIFFEELKNCDQNIFKLVNISVNQGYGFGILSGLAQASGDVLAWTHADMQTDPQDVIKAFTLYQQNYGDANIIVKGKRRNRKLLESFFTFGMQLITFAALKIYLDDINAQPKLFSKEFYEKFLKEKAPQDFSLDLFCLYQAKINNYKIMEVAVDFADRIHGEAKGGGGGSWGARIKLIRRTFKYIMELASPPFHSNNS